MTKSDELKEKIKLLNLENDSLVERVEEIEIVALISKQFEDAESAEEVFGIVLEKISIMKTIPYCSVFKIEDNKAILDTDYSYLSNDSELVKNYSFSKKIIKKITSDKQLYIDSKMENFDDIKMKFFDKYFIPDCYLLISFDLLNKPAFFLFANHCYEHDITVYSNFLEQVVSLTKSKVTNIKLLEYILNQNQNLEQIVEEKSMELYESEAKYRELIEQLPDAILIHHLGTIEFINPAAAKLLEAKTASELIGKNIFDFVVPEWQKAIKEKVEKFMVGKKEARSPLSEFEMITLKGNKKFCEASGTKFNQLGEDRTQIIIRDISNRKLHEQQIKENEEKFRLAFETSPDAIAITNLEDGSYVAINKGFESISGYKNEEIKGVSSLKLDIWENPQDREMLVEGLKRDGYVNNLKANFKLKDGGIIKGSMSARIIELNGISHLLSTTRDITEQEESKEIIETQNKFLSTVINSLSNPFVVIDTEDYTVILANPAASEGRNVIGEKCFNTYHKHNDDCNISEFCPLNQIKKTKKPYTVEHEHIDADGNLHAFEVHGHPILDKDGELIQMIEYSIDVSEQKRNLLELKASEGKFRSFFEKSVIGLALGNSKGIITDVNKAFLSIYELDKKDIVGKANNSFFSDEERKKVPSQIKRIMKTESAKFEREYLTPKGKLKYLEFNASKISNDLVFVSVKDLTESKLVSEKLKASESKFKSLIEQSPVGILIMQKSKIIFANKVLAKTLGFRKVEDLMGENIIDFVHPDFKEIAKSRMKMLMTKGKMLNSLEEKFIRKDGSVIDVLVLGQSILFEGKQAVQGYIYDITEDKKLREENRTLKLGVECVEDTGVIVTDVEGKITYVNSGFKNIYGYTEDEMICKKVSIIKSFIMGEAFYDVFEKRIKEHKSFSGELFNKTKDGTIINAEVSLTPIFSAENIFMGYIEIHKDVTERRKAEAELVKAKEAAEQADKIKSEFLAQMSHEIRTPINAIVSFSGLLKEELQDIVSEDMKTSFSLIDRAGHRIIRTIDLLLNLSEIHTGTYECILKELHLYNDVLAPIIVSYKYLAKSKNINLEVKKLTENLIVKADAYALEQIFKNLVDNALKYTKEGKVEIELTEKEEQLQVKIVDTGIGISAEYLPKLFEAFSQEESGYTRSFEGNGIGLALVNEYCRLNNINIDVESKKGIGTTFTLKFAG